VQENYSKVVKNIKYLAKFTNWKFFTGMLISALFIYLAFRTVDLSRVWLVLQSAEAFPLSIAIILTFLGFVFRAWRWDILLEPIKNTGFFSRLHATLIGFAANCLLPARLGEFIRANDLGQREKISGSSTFGTIVIERLFDGFTLLLILLIGLMGTTFPGKWQSISGSLRGAGFFMAILYIFLIVFLVGFKYKAKPFMNFLDRLLFFLPDRYRSKIVDVLWHFSLGLVLPKNPFRWVQVIFYSFMLWLTSLYQIQLIEQSISLTLPFVAPFLVLAAASFAAVIPSAPGFIGTFHYAVQSALLLYGIGSEEALSAAILWHATVFFPTIFFGFISFLFFHTPFGKLSEDPMIPKKEHIANR
jgi:hypothetical protein